MTSQDPNVSPRQLSFLEEDKTGDPPNIQRDDSGAAGIEKSALGNDHALMEEIVDELNFEIAWARVKTNRGAPGPDGVTVDQTIIRDGRHWCVDMDLSKFFDRIQHDVLMVRVARKVRDKRLLKLIGRYLRAGVMVNGVCQPSESGTMQGGPLSPLLSNIYLDDLDKELEHRGLPFVRYADDFVIFTKSEAAAHRVCASVERFITTKLKLVVNYDKSSIRRTDGLEFVGYEFRGFGGQIRVSRKKLDAFKLRVSEILRRKRGVSMKRRYAEFRSYALGWLGYFALDQVKTTFTNLDKWIRRRVRACYWKQWRKSKTRLAQLVSRSVTARVARGFAMSGKGPWRLSTTSGVQRALSNEVLAAEGLFNLEKRWSELASLRRTA